MKIKFRPSLFIIIGLALLVVVFLSLFVARGTDARIAEERVSELTTELWSTELAKDRVISQCQEVVSFAQGYAGREYHMSQAKFEYQLNDAARPCMAY